MSSAVSLTSFDNVCVITLNNPPVNALTPDIAQAVAEAIWDAENDPAAGAMVVTGAGKTFIAGADIKDLIGRSSAPSFHDALWRIESCRKPVVMAIHGAALGGGLELAMAGHYRVAQADAQFGQPEVNLGLIPGAEGTQRLPRLVGVEKAIEMCVGGRPLSSAEALEAGLIDHIVENDLLSGAVEFARRKARQGGPPPRTRELSDRLGSPEANAPLFAAARQMAAKSRRNENAPLKAIDAIEAVVSLPFEEGCRRERELFAECLASSQAKALIHAFFAEREAAKTPEITRDTPVLQIRKIGVIGAGAMGGGIAMACAAAGFEVLVKDTSEEALARGMAAVHENYQTSVKRGRLTNPQAEDSLRRIAMTMAWDGFESVDLVIEAAFESMVVKKGIFAELADVTKPECVLASNTSSLDLDEIAAASAKPEWVAGLHFFSPANVMRLVEVVRGRETLDTVLASLLAFAKALKKVPVLARNSHGFIGNRMALPYLDECQFMVEEGAAPEWIDHVLTDWGMAMGPFAMEDLSGIDIWWRIRHESKRPDMAGARKPRVVEKLYQMGRLGRKTGIGWYRYDAARKAHSDPAVAEVVHDAARDAGIARREIPREEILDRAIFALINEGAKVLEEGVALRSGDIDTVYLNGYGFPGYLGGPMWYADAVGLPVIYGRVREFERLLGARWKPASLLASLARENGKFSDFRGPALT